MRGWIWLIGLGGLLLGASPSIGAEHPTAELARKPGLWSMDLIFDDGSYKIPESFMCIDAATDRRMTIVGAQMKRSECDKYAVERLGDGDWTVSSVCTLSGADRVQTLGSIKGDISSGYTVTAESTTTGAKKPSQNGRHTIVVHARWTGACPTGQRGGDVTSNGRTANVFSPAS